MESFVRFRISFLALKMLQFFMIPKQQTFFPCSSLCFLQVYAMVKGEYFQQHKVFSISISAHRDLNKKHLFVFRVLAFLQTAIFLNLVSLSGKERKQFGGKMFVC